MDKSFGKCKRKIVVWSSVAAVLLLLVIGCGIYLGDYYHGNMAAIDGFVTEHPVETQAISNEEQIEMTVEAVMAFLEEE